MPTLLQTGSVQLYVASEIPHHQYGIALLFTFIISLFNYFSVFDAYQKAINTFNSAATELIIRSAQGNLRLCRNLCYGSLIEACRETKKIVTITHVNNVLVQPHWRSHEELIEQ